MARPGSASLLAACLVVLLAGGCDALSAPATRESLEPARVPPPSFIPVGEPAPGCKACNAALDCFDCGSGCNCSNLPPAPDPWLVPLSARGDDGWRSSMRPLCASLQEITGHSIWADQRGVFSAVSGVSAGLALDEVPDDDAGVLEEERITGDSIPSTRVFHNEGNGWSLRADLRGSKATGLTAASAEKLIVYGSLRDLGDACLLAVLSGDRLECEDSPLVRHAYAVSETRAFALVGEGSVLEHDGQAWMARTDASLGGRAIWADEDELIVVGDGGLVQRLIAGQWVPEKVGSEAVLTAVWGRNGDDLWVGDAEGRLLHFDGATWQLVGQLGGVTCARSAAIERIAGAGAHVWVHTATQLARWNGSALESFGNWTCAPLGSDQSFDSLRIEDLSAVDENDVFIAFAGGAVASCGDVYIVHFDGKEFHRF